MGAVVSFADAVAKRRAGLAEERTRRQAERLAHLRAKHPDTYRLMMEGGVERCEREVASLETRLEDGRYLRGPRKGCPLDGADRARLVRALADWQRQLVSSRAALGVLTEDASA